MKDQNRQEDLLVRQVIILFDNEDASILCQEAGLNTNRNLRAQHWLFRQFCLIKFHVWLAALFLLVVWVVVTALHSKSKLWTCCMFALLGAAKNCIAPCKPFEILGVRVQHCCCSVV